MIGTRKSIALSQNKTKDGPFTESDRSEDLLNLRDGAHVGEIPF